MSHTQLPLFGKPLENARINFFRALEMGDKTDCPCCGRFAQVYRRRLHSSVCLQLIKLYQLGGALDYIHSGQLVPDGMACAGDFTKGKYWGLIEEETNNDATKKRSGYWRLTLAGIDFVRRGGTVQEWALIYDDELRGFEGKRVSMQDCLGKKFDYQELMNGGKNG